MYSTPTPRSVGTDTPSSSASFSSVSILASSPFSKRYSAAREMPRRRAISSALKPAPNRKAFSRLPMSSNRNAISRRVHAARIVQKNGIFLLCWTKPCGRRQALGMRSSGLVRAIVGLAVAMTAVTASLLAAAPSAAANFPSRPLRLLVPFPPGGGNDLIARMLGGRLAEAYGQQVVVDNRAGGGGVIATDIAAKAPPDGYTIALGFIGPLAIAPNVARVPYDPVKDFAALDILASSYH